VRENDGVLEKEMTDCKEVQFCRVCGWGLGDVLNLGDQCLAGQFPARGEPDPPRFPLALKRCVEGCGLIQLGHTVNPELLFRRYGYRSAVTATMRLHLGGLAEEAVKLLGRGPNAVLDIGGNDGTLASCFDNAFVIDPSDVTKEMSEAWFNRPYGVLSGFFPQCLPESGKLAWGPFDLIFTIACFYDAHDPVAFVKAVRDNLASNGLWCCEVSHLGSVLENTAYDTICHEHLLYFAFDPFCEILRRGGLSFVCADLNDCNGGSMRVYACRDDCLDYPALGSSLPCVNGRLMQTFAERVEASAASVRSYLDACRRRGDIVHLLGASTKANVWLQHCGVTSHYIQAASDRDPRKHGKRTPGTGIPILSEEESRSRRPDVYLVGPWHFESEIIEREKGFLARGGRLAFPLPRLKEVKA
jgi:hypothetical protein